MGLPSSCFTAEMEQLHKARPGKSRMKGLARMFVWWPGMDREIEALIKACCKCEACQPAPPADPLHPRKWPTHPWSHIYVNYAGPIDGKMMLVQLMVRCMFPVLIDAHSKWIEVFCVQSASTSNTTEKLLLTVFSQFGIPETIVTDLFSLITSAPYHPS